MVQKLSGNIFGVMYLCIVVSASWMSLSSLCSFCSHLTFFFLQIIEEDASLVEIGPRFVLNLIKIFQGSFGGPTLYENPGFKSPNMVGCTGVDGLPPANKESNNKVFFLLLTYHSFSIGGRSDLQQLLEYARSKW